MSRRTAKASETSTRAPHGEPAVADGPLLRAMADAVHEWLSWHSGDSLHYVVDELGRVEGWRPQDVYAAVDLLARDARVLLQADAGTVHVGAWLEGAYLAEALAEERHEASAA